MPKKKILFIMNNLNMGGAEKALVSLLQVFDYNRYDVDLFLFKREGIFLNQVPPEVQILPAPQNYIYFDGPVKKAILENLKKLKIRLIFDRICFGFLQRRKFSDSEKEQRSWKYIKNHLPNLEKEYDAAIGFLEKTPNYFCAEKIVAKKKIGFVHTDYKAMGMVAKYDIFCFRKLDFIVTVSRSCFLTLKNVFPQFEHKFMVIQNISSVLAIKKRAAESVNRKIKLNSIVSVGRLTALKNYQLAINAAEILKERGLDFEWIVVGEGEERENLQKLIEAKKLEGFFNLVGLQENPYPFIKKSLIYVHCSKFEGKSIAVDEAKILEKPVILTNFPTAKDQIENGKNGLIVEMNAESLADAITSLLKNEKLREKLSKNLSAENSSNDSELEKFYQLIEA